MASFTAARGLRFKLLFFSVLTSTAVLVGLGAVNYASREREARAQLTASLDGAVSRLSTGLVAPVWDLRNEEGLVLLRNEMSAPDLAAIAVLADGDALFAGVARGEGGGLAEKKDGKLDELVPPVRAAGLATRGFEVKKGDKVIAHGQLLYSEDAIRRQLRTLLVMAAAEVVLVDGLLIAVLYVVLSALVLRPLGRLGAEAEQLRGAVARGELATRADPAVVAAEFRPALAGMNAVLEEVVAPIRVARRTLDAISRGEVPAKLSEAWQGEFDAIQADLNRCIDAVNALVADARRLAQAGVEGRLEVRADAARHRGDFRRIIEGVNGTLDAVIAPVSDARQILERLAARDLRARVDGEYQGGHAALKEAVNATAAALHDALAQVAASAAQVSSASDHIASGSQEVASGASEQASALEETTASLENMTAMTQKLASDAAAADEVARQAHTAAGSGSRAVAQMSGAMTRIRASADGTAQIIKEVNEIAFQTNLLALNAAVEAARAGEAGRGFAVVAEEVRSLALRSKEAAHRTESLIRESVHEAGAGEATARTVAAELGGIVTAIGRVSGLVGEITAAAREQSAGIDQITGAITDMGKVVQQNAAWSEESSSSAQELSAQAQGLSALVGTFRLEAAAGGGLAASPPPAPASSDARPRA